MSDLLEANKTLLSLVKRLTSKIKQLQQEQIPISTKFLTNNLTEDQKAEISQILIETKKILEED